MYMSERRWYSSIERGVGSLMGEEEFTLVLAVVLRDRHPNGRLEGGKIGKWTRKLLGSRRGRVGFEL